MPKHRDALTPKQKLFVKKMVETKGNRTEAYLQSYDTKSRRNAKLGGAVLMKKPHIREAVNEALESKGMTLDWILEQDKQIIESGIKYGKPSMSDARMTLESLKKLYNAYPEKINKNISLSVREEVEAKNTSEILESLKKLQDTTQKLVSDLNT